MANDAVTVIFKLLAADSALIAVVPAARIMAGLIQQGTTPPAIGITHVDTQRTNFLTESGGQLCNSRVQVTVHASAYADLGRVLTLVRAAIPRKPGTINSVKVDSIVDDSEGPDFPPEVAGAYARSQDFRVIYSE